MRRVMSSHGGWLGLLACLVFLVIANVGFASNSNTVPPDHVNALVWTTGENGVPPRYVPVPARLMNDAPDWAGAGYRLMVDGTNRLYLNRHVDKATIFVMPDAWKNIRTNPNAVTTNYGYDPGAAAQGVVGQLQTNDPDAGPPDGEPDPEKVVLRPELDIKQLIVPASIGLAVLIASVGLVARLFGRKG